VLIGGLFLCWAFPTRWRLLIAPVMVVAHREIGTVMAAALFFLEDEKDGNLVVGIVLGHALHLLYQYGVLDTVPQSRMDYTIEHLHQTLTTFMTMPGVYIINTFSWYWGVLCLNRPRRKEGLVFTAAFLLALLCSDFTRDFVLTALPALLFYTERLVVAGKLNGFEKWAPLTLLQTQVALVVSTYTHENVFLSSLVK
jgi:hypothetical protein